MGGRVVLRPVGSPMSPVMSPIRKITGCPRSWKCFILRSSTVWPRCRSGAVGSKPAFTRNGRPVFSAWTRRSRNSSSRIRSARPFFRYASCSSMDTLFIKQGQTVRNQFRRQLGRFHGNEMRMLGKQAYRRRARSSPPDPAQWARSPSHSRILKSRRRGLRERGSRWLRSRDKCSIHGRARLHKWMPRSREGTPVCNPGRPAASPYSQ